MKKFIPNADGWFCGWWNDSELQINCAERATRYKNEVLHYHKDFCEYYYVISGHIVLEVNGKKLTISENEIVLVEPMEQHQVIELSGTGCKYMTIKSKSYEDNKIIV